MDCWALPCTLARIGIKMLKFQKMKKREEQVRQLGRSVGRTNSSENLLARRLHRNNSHSKLTPLNSSMSLLGSLHTSLIPSVSLRKLVRLDHSPPSLEISQGRIHLKRPDELSSLGQSQPLLKKKPLPRKFEKIDSIAEKSFLPEELKESKIDAEGPPRKFKPTRKWLTKLKQGKDMFEQKLTPEDFIQLIEEEGGLGNQFCYLQKGDNPYDLRIVQFGGLTGDQYITISGRGVTYFNWEGSRFVSLEQWKREAQLFAKLMKLEFFGKYKLQKNFSNWKKYSRKNGMKKTTDKLKAELLVNDRHLRHALLSTRDLCCRMEKENYCCLEESASPLTFSKFKAAQENYLQQQFEKRLGQIQEEIKGEVAKSLSISMRDFKEQNKISSGKQAKGLPLLIGDEKNLEMPYTKEATLRVQQEKFKRFLKLVELLVVHSKVGMMSEATVSVARRLEEENQNYIDFMGVKNARKENFKGRQYMECQLLVEEGDERVLLRPSRQQLTTLMEDIVNKSIIKLVRNHHRIIADPDINAILYEGSQEHPKDLDPTNTLKAILAAEDKQEEMVALLTRPLNLSYSFLENFVAELNPLVAQYFQNQRQLSTIPNLTAADHFTIREWIQRWRKELTQMGKLNEEHDSAVFVLNFKTVKEMAIQCANLCLAKTRQIVPKMLQNALRQMDAVLREALKLMQTSPIGIEAFIAYQHNKTNITGRLDDYEDRLGEIGQLIQIIKDVGSAGETAILRGIKERKQLGQTLKTLRAKMEEAEMHSKVHENYAQQEVRKMIPKVLVTLQQLYSLTRQPRPNPNQMANKLLQWRSELSFAEAQLGKLKQYQKFLGMQEASEDSLKRFTSYFQTYSKVWGHRLAVQKYYNILLSQQWRNCQTVAVRAVLEGFLEEAIIIKKEITRVNLQEEYQIQYVQQNELSSAIAQIKKKIYPLLEAIQCLKDPSLEERELKFIRCQFQRRQHYQLSSLIGQRQGLVRDLSNLEIVQELDFLKKIVFKSKKQLELNSKMASVSRFWGESGSHSSKSLIEDFSQHYWSIAEEIDEKITILNCVRQDPEIQQGEFKTRVESEKGMFDSLKGLLGEWEKHHHFLTYFEPIFQHSFWKGTPEGKSFACAESNWRKLTKQISKDFSLRKLASQQRKHLAVLKENNAIFADLKKSVEAFLNTKRQAFPKLYFLADEELLHFLLQDKDYASIDKHLSRIFPHLKSLELSEDHNSPTALRSSVDQVLTLRPSPAKQVLQLEQGLRVIQQRMRQAVRSGLLRCNNYYLQDDFVKSQWIKQNLLQVLLFIGSAEFTKLLEYDYLQPDGEDLQQLLNYQIVQIKQLHGMIKQQMHSGEHKSNNYKISVLLMQAAHFRDIILKLLKEGVTDDNDYQWQSQIRSYYNGNDLAVTKYFGRAIEYGYEFVCPNYSYTLSTLSEKQMIEMVNVAGLGYLPVLKGNNSIVEMISTTNARSYFSVALKSNLSTNYLHNLCQGALSSNTYLQVSGLKYLNEQSLAILSAFIFEAKAIIERKQAFHLSSLSKGTAVSTAFNLVFRATQQQTPFIQQNLKIGYRCLSVPEVSISAYMTIITELAFCAPNIELASKIQKCCEIINSCCGWRVIGLDEIRKFVVQSLCPDFTQFSIKMAKAISVQISSKIVQPQQLKLLDSLVQQVMLDVRPQQGAKVKVKSPQSESKSILLQQILKKRQSCVLVGPGSGGRRLLVSQAAKQNGLQVGLALYLDLMSKEQLLGSFENGLWKEGILSRCLRKLRYSQQQWVIFQGKFQDVSIQLLGATMKGKLLQGNGEYMYLSPNWRFIFLTQVLSQEVNLQGCEAIYCQNFVNEDEQLQYALERRVSEFFQSNSEAFSALKNYCINNYQKLCRLRLKEKYLRGQHLISCYVDALESLLAKCPNKLLQQKQSFLWIEKLAQWCIFWTVSTALSPNQIVKFESQFSESSKSDFGQSLSASRFQFDTQGSFKKVQQHSVKLKDNPFLVNEQMEATAQFAMNLIGRNKHILFVGEGSCGKTQFLTYLKENLGHEYYSYLQIRITKNMSFENFRQLLFRRAKIVVNAARERRLSAINGKKLILILQDINLLQEDGQVGNFLKMILAHKHFYDSLTYQKIDLGNICILAAQNSSYESNLSYDFIKSLKPISISSPSIREIAELYHPLLPSEYSVQLCHNIAALHQFAHLADEGQEIFYRRGIDAPLRILKMLRGYSGRQNPVKIWQYLSIKQYLQSNKVSQSFNGKILAQVKNYSNLMLKNNQQQPLPIENQDIFIKQLTKRFPTISIDTDYMDYYVHVAMLLQLSNSFNLFTINEPMCPSHKEEIMFSICVQNQVEFLHPYRADDLNCKIKSHNKVLIYLSDEDDYFQEIIQEILIQNKQNYVYFVDFTTEQSWKNTMKIYPSIIHYGCRYFKQPTNSQKLSLSEIELPIFDTWIEVIGKLKVINWYSQQQISRLIPRNTDKLRQKLQTILSKKQRILKNTKQIQQNIITSKKQSQNIEKQLHQLIKLQQKKRKQLLQIKNSYSGELSQALKSERSEKIQVIQLQLSDILGKRRNNQDQNRVINEQFVKYQRIIKSTKKAVLKIEQQFNQLTEIKNSFEEIVVFISILEYFYTKNGSDYDLALQQASKQLKVEFSQIFHLLFDCHLQIVQKYPIIWLLNGKSIILSDEKDQFSSLIDKKHKNVQVIREVKDFQDITTFEQDKAYIFIGEIKSQASYLSDIAKLSSDKQKLKKDEIKDREDRFIKEQKEQRADYNRNIYFIYKEKQRDEKTATKDSNELTSTLSVKSKEKEEVIPRRIERKVTRLNTIRNTLSFASTHSTKKEDSRFSQKDKTFEYTNQLKQEATIRIKYKQARQTQNFNKSEQQFLDYLVFNIQNEIFYNGGKKIISITHSKSKKVLTNVSFILKKPSQRIARQHIHVYQSVYVDDTDILFEQILENLDPIRTSLIKNLQQQLQKMKSKLQFQYELMLRRLEQNTQKSLSQLAKDGDFLMTMTQNVQQFEQRLKQARRQRLQPYQNFFTYVLTLQQFYFLMKKLAPYMKMDKFKIKKIIFSSIRHKQIGQEQQQKTTVVDEAQSITQLKQSIIRGIIFSQNYMDSMFTLLIFAVMVQVKEQNTHKDYITALIGIKNATATLHTLEDLLNKKQCSKQLSNTIQAYIKGSGNFIHLCHRYLSYKLHLQLETEYYKRKSEWVILNQPLMFIACEGSDPFSELVASKNCYFIKENTDHTKCVEIMGERGINRLVLVDFSKEEVYQKIVIYLQELTKQAPLKVSLLYTSSISYQKCNFKHRLSDYKIIVLQQQRTTNRQILITLYKTLQTTKGQYEKLFRFTLYNDLINYLKQKIQSHKKGHSIENSSFFSSEYLTLLLSEVKLNPKSAKKLLTQRIFIEQQEALREAKKIIKKDEDAALKVHAQNMNDDGCSELNYFYKMDLGETMAKLTSTAQCQDFARIILPLQQRKKVCFDIFYSFIVPSKSIDKIQSQNLSLNQQWQTLDNLTFEQFKSLQSISSKRQYDLFKLLVKEYNIRYYLYYKYIEHEIKSLRGINRSVILSEKTQNILSSLKSQKPCLGLKSSIPKALQILQKRIYYFEQLFTNSIWLKKMHPDHLDRKSTLINIYLYSTRRGNPTKEVIYVRAVGEKEQKERGWLIGQAQLINCKYDASKNLLEVSEKNQSKKHLKVALMLGQKQIANIPTIHLPLYLREQQRYRIEIPCKWKDEGHAPKQKIYGIIKLIE